MILLVLILTLELVVRTKTQGVAVEHRQVAVQLRSAVDALERQAAALRTELSAVQAAALRDASFSEAEVRNRERVAAARATALAEEIAALEADLASAASMRRRSEGDLLTARRQPTESAETVAAMSARVSEIEMSNAAERARQNMQRAKGIDSSGAKTLVFNTPPGESLTPRLLEVSGDGLAAVNPGDGPPVRFRGVGGEFTRWLGSIDRTREYVVIVLRPSGIGTYDAVGAAIREAGLALGLELVGESMAVSLGSGK
jgi:hypothetical protein